MAGICIICGERDANLVTCRDVSSWATLYDSAVIHEHQGILSLSSARDKFPEVSVFYHRQCRSTFTLKKGMNLPSTSTMVPSSKPLTRGAGHNVKSDILPPRCIFCNKDKYKARERTREKLKSVEEFRADNKVKDSALKHIRANSRYKNAAEAVLLLLSKDLISSEAKYHPSCYKVFVKILYENRASVAENNFTENTGVVEERSVELVSDAGFLHHNLRVRHDPHQSAVEIVEKAALDQDIADVISDPPTEDSDSDDEVVYSTTKTSNNESNLSNHELETLFQPVREFCESLIKCPDIVQFKVIRKIIYDKAVSMNIVLHQSYQNNLLRRVSSNFPDLNFVHREHNCVLVYPNTLNINNLVLNYHNICLELKRFNELNDEEKCVVDAGKLLHSVVQNHPECISWPPKDEELKAENVPKCIPNLLDLFCKSLFNGSTTCGESKRSFLRRNVIAQDIVYSVSNGRIKTPKSILFPCVVKAQCNNLEVNKLINIMGHGISSNLIREIDTENALEAINQQLEQRVVIPEEEQLLNDESNVALLVADNIDNLENTETGFGTSHRVNSILITSGKKREDTESERGEAEARPTKRRCLRSLPSDKVMKEIPEYYHGKRFGPGELAHLKDLDKSTKYNDLSKKQKLNLLMWVALRSLKTSPSLLVPGWTGFNILIRKNVVVIESKITYLDTLDSPATYMKTAYEVLSRGCEIKQRLQLKSVLCVFDQAFYAKAAEVLWKHKEHFQDLVLMLGGFHLLMMFLGVLGTRFGDAGFKDIAVQSEMIAEGSINKVLDGKHYNRAIRSHKIVYESLSRLLYERFMDWMSQEQPSTVIQVNKILEEMKKNMNTERFDDFEEKDLLQNLNSCFYRYRQMIQKDGTDLQKFWFSYLETCELLLNLVYATRVGDWEFYLACIEQVIPWAFAYDRQKYARYLLPYLNDMRSLPLDKPEVYEALCEGEFSVQMKNSNRFGRNEADKTIENTINRDCKTSGGYIGFSASFSATQRWVLNAARRGHYRRILNEHINSKPKMYVHREMLPSAIKRDMAVVEKVITCIEELFLSPWEGDELISLSSGIVATPELIDDLLNAKNKGLGECMKFLNFRCSANPEIDFFETLTKTNLRTFSSLKKTVTVSSKDKLIPLKMDKELFARITLLSQFRKIDMKLLFQYPLGPLPWSIADAFGMPRKTNKAKLMHNLEQEGVPADKYPSSGTTIFDAMAVLRKFQPASRSIFRDVSKSLFKLFTTPSSQAIHIVFDVYRNVSIKNMERLRRGPNGVEGVQYRNILPSYPVKSWNKLMSSSQNKQEIVKFLAAEWKKTEFRSQLSGKTVFVTEGSQCWKITEEGFAVVPELGCSHEEADTRMLLHAKFATGPVTIHADDTDVFILLLGHCNNLPECYMKVGKAGKARVLSIDSIKTALLQKFDHDFLSALIGMHAFTGCDSISSFAGKGKIKAIKLLMKHPEFIPYFEELGSTWIVTDEMINNLTEFVCDLYGKRMEDIDLLRYRLYCAKGGKVDPDALPPCKSTLVLHIKRANYQACIWRRALIQNPVVPSPDGHGWDADDSDISIKWLGASPAPDEILALLNCLCKRACKVESCCCIQARLKCTDLCTTKCTNMIDEGNSHTENGPEDDEDTGASDIEDEDDLE